MEKVKLRHLPYYHENKLQNGESYTEEIKDDPVQGLGVAGRSGFLEIYDTEVPEAYAEVVIFDGNSKSEIIPLFNGGSINYVYEDNIWAEWVKITARGGWIAYKIHWVPGLHPELEEEGEE